MTPRRGRISFPPLKVIQIQSVKTAMREAQIMQMIEFETLKKMVAEVEDDVAKAYGGNKAAGVRVRQAMQKIKAAAQDVRKKILEGREPGDEGND